MSSVCYQHQQHLLCVSSKIEPSILDVSRLSDRQPSALTAVISTPARRTASPASDPMQPCRSNVTVCACEWAQSQLPRDHSTDDKHLTTQDHGGQRPNRAGGLTSCMLGLLQSSSTCLPFLRARRLETPGVARNARRCCLQWGGRHWHRP